MVRIPRKGSRYPVDIERKIQVIDKKVTKGKSGLLYGEDMDNSDQVLQSSKKRPKGIGTDMEKSSTP